MSSWVESFSLDFHFNISEVCGVYLKSIHQNLWLVSIHMGQVTKLWLSCHLVLLSIDSKTRQQDSRSFLTWPIYGVRISILKIRYSHKQLILIMGITIPGKTVFILKSDPQCNKWHHLGNTIQHKALDHGNPLGNHSLTLKVKVKVTYIQQVLKANKEAFFSHLVK